MKYRLLLFLVIIPVFLLGQIGITFTFANNELTSNSGIDYLEFDVMANATATGTKIGTGIVLINYNTLAFGEWVKTEDKVTVTEGILTTIPFYNITVNDNQSYRLAITFEYALVAGYGNDLPTNPTQLLHVKIEIEDTQEMAELFFAESLMNLQQYYDDNATKYNPVIAIDVLDVPLPVTLSSFTGVFENNLPTLHWTTQSETDNMGFNVYRSISQNLGQSILLNVNSIIEGAGNSTAPTNYTFVDMYDVEENFTYYYWIESVDNAGETEMFGPVSLTIPLGGTNQGTPITPDSYGLQQNYPNPFNPSTSISFALEVDSNVELIIYNIKGRKIKSIFNDHIFADQVNTTVWDGKDTDGKEVSSGVYFYKLTTNTKEYLRKMLLVK